MGKVKLSDVCDLLNGYAFKSSLYTESGLRVIRITNVQNGYIEDSDPKFYDICKEHELKNYILKENDLLISLTGNVGRVGVLQKEMLPALLNQRVGCIRIKNEIILNKRYLFNMLNNKFFENACINNSKGIAQKNLSTEWLKDYEINLPNIQEQEKIANELDKVQEIIDIKTKQIEELDKLIKSQFVEMFGNPIFNNKNWETNELNNVAPSKPYKGELQNKVWLLNLDMVESQSGRIIDYIYENIENVGNSTCKFSEENVLYSKLRPYLNKVVIPDKKGIATSELIPLLPEKNILGRYFLAYLLRSDEFVKYISEKVAGAKMPRVSMEIFRNFKIILPPIELQNQFAEFVKLIDKQKFELQKSLEEIEKLQESLMNKYFG